MKSFPRLLPLLLLPLLAGLMAGCSSLSNEGMGGKTAVVIYGHSLDEIMGATLVVFEQNHFHVVSANSREAVFERKGSGWQNAAYGSWMGGSIYEQSTIKATSLAAGGIRLEAHVELVDEKDDPFFRDNYKVGKKQVREYQKYLNQVITLLDIPNPEPVTPPAGS